jgi:orotate phosphoribosyltransferase
MMNFGYVDFRRALRPDHDGQLFRVDDAIEAATLLTGATSDKPLLLVDFEEITYLKSSTWADLVDLALTTCRHLALFCVNFDRQLVRALAQNTDAKAALRSQNTVWPIMSKAGDAVWLGASASVGFYLTELLRGELVPSSGLGAEVLSCFASNPEFVTALPDLDSYGPSPAFAESLHYMGTLATRRIAGLIEHGQAFRTGHFELPSGLHSDVLFQSSLLLNEPDTRRRIASEVARRARSLSIDTVVASSLFATTIAKDVVELLGTPIRVIEAYGYPDPRPRFANELQPTQRVLVIGDAVTTGRSLTSLRNLVLSSHGSIADTLVIYDATGTADRLNISAIVRGSSHVWTPGESCPGCRRQHVPLRVDPFTSMPYAVRSPTKNVQSKISSELFWKLVLEAEALREGHLSFNGHHFSVFIETHKLWRKPDVVRQVARAIVDEYQIPFDCIVYPAHEGATGLALEIPVILQDRFGLSERPPAVPASRASDGECIISTSYEQDIANKVVLIFDDGANFGDTLASLFMSVSHFSPAQIHCCVFIDRLSEFYRNKLKLVLGRTSLTSMFYLPFPPYQVQRCPVCRQARQMRRLDEKGSLLEAANRQLSLVLMDSPFDGFIDPPLTLRAEVGE